MKTAIKERGILMHARSVLNILAGRKTQTRRIVKVPQPRGKHNAQTQADFDMIPDKDGTVYITSASGVIFDTQCGRASKALQDRVLHCPLGQPGDRLWVRETWAVHFMYNDLKPSRIRPPEDMKDPPLSRWGCHQPGDGVWYRATSEDIPEPANGCNKSHRGVWRPSLFMPRWASRITLEIVSVRVERVQDITAADCMAEGLVEWTDPPRVTKKHYGAGIADVWETDPVKAFARLWNDTNGKGAWERNDWCWCIEFKRIGGPNA